MAFLADTSILARLANTSDAHHAIARRAIIELHRRGETVHAAPQNLVEFRNCATRPVAANGLGLSAADAEARADEFEALFPLLPETPEIYLVWKTLAHDSGVIGRQVHDARLVAICHVHRIERILTFNARHFARFAGLGPGITVVEPHAV